MQGEVAGHTKQIATCCVRPAALTQLQHQTAELVSGVASALQARAEEAGTAAVRAGSEQSQERHDALRTRLDTELGAMQRRVRAANR